MFYTDSDDDSVYEVIRQIRTNNYRDFLEYLGEQLGFSSLNFLSSKIILQCKHITSENNK